MRKLTKEEYQHVKDWMKLHKNADELVFDNVTRLPLRAIYHCPFGQFDKEKREEVVKALANMDKIISDMEAL